jgi:hypothetical protein
MIPIIPIALWETVAVLGRDLSLVICQLSLVEEEIGDW